MRLLCLIGFLISQIGFGQAPPAPRSIGIRRVAPGRMYERVYAIVPVIGTGSWDDPKRPMLTVPPHQATPGNRTGILAFNHAISDNGQFALVEIVAATRADLATAIAPVKTLISQGSPGLQVFERGTSTPQQVQTAFQALRKDFDITKFRVVVP